MRFANLAVAVLAIVASASTASATEIRLLVERLDTNTNAVTGFLLARDQPFGTNDDDAALESVRVSDTSLAAVFPELQVGSFVTASTNRATTDDFRTLSLDSLFVVRSTAANLMYRYRVTAAADNMTQPTADNKLASSSHTARFTTATPVNNTQYQGWVDPNNAMAVTLAGTVAGLGSVSPGLHGPFASTSAAGTGTNSVSTDLGPVAFTEDVPYSLAAQIITNVRRGGPRVQSGGDLTVSASPIPEPTTMFLFGSGLIGMVAAARRRK